MAEKTQVAVVVIKGEVFIRRNDVVRLILNIVPAMDSPDDRQMVKQLAENIDAGEVK